MESIESKGHATTCPLRLPLPITSVTVFPAQARVERSAPLPEGDYQDLIIPDLPPLLLDSSVQVRVDNAAIDVLEVRVDWDLSVPDASQRPALARNVEAAELELEALRDKAGGIRNRSEFWKQLTPRLYRRPANPRYVPDSAKALLEPSKSWSDTIERVDSKLRSAHKAARTLKLEIEEAEKKLELARDALARASSSEDIGPLRRCLSLRLRKRSIGAIVSEVQANADTPEKRGGVSDDNGHSSETDSSGVQRDNPSPQLTISYLVPGATWVPSYEVRLGPELKEAEIAVRALVAQRSDEDWKGVKLALSTSDGRYTTELPVLSAMRIGRAQAPVSKSGWRPPPEGLDSLFSDYDRHKPGNSERGSPGVRPSLRRRQVRTDSHPMADRDGFEAVTSREPRTGRAQEGVMLERNSLSAMMEEAEEGLAEPMAAVEASAHPPRATGAFAPQSPPAGGASAPPLLAAKSVVAPESHRRAKPMAKKAKAIPALSRSRGSRKPPELDVAFGGIPDAEFPEAAREQALDTTMLQEPAMAYGGGGVPSATSLEIGDDWLCYDELRLASAQEPQRGKLRKLSLRELLNERLRAPGTTRIATNRIEKSRNSANQVLRLDLPAHARAVRDSRGRFDHRYEAELAVDIPSDGRFHSLTLTRARTSTQIEYHSVPRVEPAVYRSLVLNNPLNAPLLAGPADLYVGADLLATSLLETVAEGGEIRLGLGLEEKVKVARNTHFKESSTGLLSNMHSLEHEIHYAITSQLEHAIQLELYERLPITDDPDIEIKQGKSQPAAEPYEQVERGHPVKGGRRLKVEVEPRGQSEARFSYKVVISSKQELMDGNRRD